MSGAAGEGAPPADPPPPIGTWRAWYLLVAGELAAIMLACWALTRWAQG